MRTWRVGTFSMGASLLFLGIFLLFSQVLNINLINVMSTWWPVILVVLGMEILVYLFLNKQEKPILKYDFLSIIFVGIIGMVGIGFAIVSSIGLVDELELALNKEERTLELPSFDKTLSEKINRIVVNAEHYPITVESTDGKGISLFGTYRTTINKNEKLISASKDYVMSYEKGDTLFITIKTLPEIKGPFQDYPYMDTTILVPDDVKLEINGEDNLIRMKPRKLLSNWIVNQASTVNLIIDKKSDILVTADAVTDLLGEQQLWNISKESQAEQDYEPKDVSYQQGKGTHSLSIFNTNALSLNIIE